MAHITIQKPCDQPTGRLRLLEELRQALSSPAFDRFRLMVAFAKVGPLLRLSSEIGHWREADRAIEAIVGIDHRGTSKEALEFALERFSKAWIAHLPAPFRPTFHPKVYLFSGPQRALAFLGSNNLTVGGTETNLEVHLRIEMDLPADQKLHTDLVRSWEDALAVSTELTSEVLLSLVRANQVLPESEMRGPQARAREAAADSPAAEQLSFPGLRVLPPSPLPASAFPRRPRDRRQGGRVPTAPSQPSITQTLVIQIVPHHNGEVFLSKRAVDQDPAFFGWPFQGLTTPKKGSNEPYPQRVPDPVVDLRVYDRRGHLAIRHDPFPLNTVYYRSKSEIRVTVPGDVVRAVPAYSILVMSPSRQRDYEMDIYPPHSPQYGIYLQLCNQTMPSGGGTRGRRFGWL